LWGGLEPLAVSRLFIARSGPNVVVSWSPATPGFVLQISESLEGASWTNAPSGASNPVTAPQTGRSRFYRLVD
jgi:hypothetical protein